jgi:hypothetical protein
VTSPEAAPTAIESATFSVPARDVWSYRLDFANLPDYNPDVSGVVRTLNGEGVGGVHGPGARYGFQLADSREGGRSHPVELWTIAAEESSLVVAGMQSGNGSEAYEEFVVRATDGGGCEATLSLWVTLPGGLALDADHAFATGSRQQIRKELDLMKVALEKGSNGPSVH